MAGPGTLHPHCVWIRVLPNFSVPGAKGKRTQTIRRSTKWQSRLRLRRCLHPFVGTKPHPLGGGRKGEVCILRDPPDPAFSGDASKPELESGVGMATYHELSARGYHH